MLKVRYTKKYINFLFYVYFVCKHINFAHAHTTRVKTLRIVYFIVNIQKENKTF